MVKAALTRQDITMQGSGIRAGWKQGWEAPAPTRCIPASKGFTTPQNSATSQGTSFQNETAGAGGGGELGVGFQIQQ